MHLGDGQSCADREKGDGRQGAVLKGELQKRLSRSLRELRELPRARTGGPLGQWEGNRSMLLN